MSHETCPECDRPLRLCICEAKAKNAPAVDYLRKLYDARDSTAEADWQRADRFIRAAIELLDLGSGRLTLAGYQAITALAIELAEEIGYKLP